MVVVRGLERKPTPLEYLVKYYTEMFQRNSVRDIIERVSEGQLENKDCDLPKSRLTG